MIASRVLENPPSTLTLLKSNCLETREVERSLPTNKITPRAAPQGAAKFSTH